MMTSATIPFPIYYTPDVHNFYVKQKHEFHFNQKSDNDFLMFLLDTAVRVISIVQHLAPVIEAVSDASPDIDETEDLSPNHNNSNNVNFSGSMDVDNPPSLLSAELQQINQEITSAQDTSHHEPQASFHVNGASRRLQTSASELSVMLSTPSVQSASAMESIPALQPAPLQPAPHSLMQPTSDFQSTTDRLSTMQTPSLPTSLQTTHLDVSSQPIASSVAFSSDEQACLPPNIPATQLSTSAQSSENLPTTLPSAAQPIAEAPSTNEFKAEQPVPEVFEIKEEIEEIFNKDYSSDFQHIMTSISGSSSGLHNFVPTANPSSLPPSFLDRSSNNPLSMVGSMHTGDLPGPSGVNVPNISESMMKNINDAGLNVSNIKGQANPIIGCPCCPFKPSTVKTSYSDAKRNLKFHIQVKHLNIPRSKNYKCEFCGKAFLSNSLRARHFKVHLKDTPMYECPACGKKFAKHYLLDQHLLEAHKDIHGWQ